MFPSYIKFIYNLCGLKVFPYGIMIGIGIGVCLLVFYFYTKKDNMPEQVQDFVFIVAVFAIALGFLFAKLFQAFYDLLAGKGWNFASAGITVMGGLLGGASAFLILYFCVGKLIFKNKNELLHVKEFYKIINVAPVCITVAHAFGRIGCLFGGCCHGAYLGIKEVAGGIYMCGNDGWGYYIPIQLYESIFLFALFAALSVLYFKRCNIIMHIYLIAYGVWRFLIEFLRGDYRGGSGFLSPSQWTSLIFIGIGVILLIVYYYKNIPFFKKGKSKSN